HHFLHFPSSTPPGLRHPSLSFQKFDRFAFSTSFSSSQPSPPTTASTGTTPSTPFLNDPYRTGRFLTNEEFDKLRSLESFAYDRELRSGSLRVRVMRAEEMDETVRLLAESFAESMLLPGGYVSLLRFLVKQYLIERRSVMPHAATLVGFYKGGEEGEEELAGTVEVCFDKRGSNASPPTPAPPRNSPYICNMTVKEELRRRGIGWHLLKASEELISRMCSLGEVYLHCRMIDLAPFNMYTKAGYRIVKTDNILVLLMLQRRKHLMSKKLLVLDSPLELDKSGPDQEQTS
ncbi:N-acetyltransferase domain-containing protein, partial [Psidium guajava]